MCDRNSDVEQTVLEVRDARRGDMTEVAAMIQELADFEKMPDGPKLTEAELIRDGFDREPALFYCKVCVRGSRVVGYCLLFPTYSTWRGAALQLEDLYVRPGERGAGAGTMLFNAALQEGQARGAARVDFHVLEWNPACSFYERRGAVNLTSSERWCYYRVDGGKLYQ